MTEHMDQNEMLAALGIDEKSTQKFENMMCGYFGLRSIDDLYKLREIVEKMHELFNDARYFENLEQNMRTKDSKCEAE